MSRINPPILVLLAASAACGSTPSPGPTGPTEAPAEITGVTWVLTRISSGPPESARRVTLHVGEDGQISGQAPVNNYMAPGVAGEDGSWSLETPALTDLAGTIRAMDQEQTFLRQMERVDGWRVRGGTLELTAGGRVVLEFRPEGDE